MQPLNQKQNRIILRFEQDQGWDRWIPLEDEDCVPDKRTYDFLVFLGKDPASEEFYVTTAELEEIINIRYAIDLLPTKGALIETKPSYFTGVLFWKDHLHNRFIGMKRNRTGRYLEPETAASKEVMTRRLLGLELVKETRNIHK